MPSPPNTADHKDMWSGCNSGLAGMAVSLAVVASSSLLSAGGTITAADYVTVLAVWAFIVSFAISLGPIPWLMASELFPVGVCARRKAS